ncbi:DsbA family oxidoreductase [Trinickia caryophylli]|uniref:Predicted dithiol-disulfide isomerase, DsbA family n=1 Tax=Trinickia caryophylli TaxID=28094 RepID=A0A1X7H8D7_TRICW|nr:DsbA family oxidoreductase [Trinickia caryophylli]PMS09487.1 DsbA family oxidoreductase [Trinickia caryophylli]TRX14080.1 DsbA family oxidoreductase [Trinickia caryophylli]WQE13900.1 DsbA family oxidoreductase [Trinickia caryophylli]SMF81490.1 Predicted dithiol-disulfide isomerase, DsbA family [Trinickia caryophylli]GLU35758.1 2-hydroxychromene-2-carboxylate isomerase [Trinickia caryophylli]
MLDKDQTMTDALTVEIWHDVICPICPIGVRRFRKALDQFDGRDRVKVVYRSYRLMRNVVPHSVDEHIAHKFGRGQKAAPILKQVSQVAAQEGITYDLENTLAGDTLDAHRLLYLAGADGKQKALIERFHRGYFSEHANLFDPDALLRLAVEAGLDEPSVADVLDGDRFTANVEADQAEAHARGIRSVPHFLIDRRISVSGGQAPEDFLAALNSTWTSRPPLEGNSSAELSCGDDGCYAPIRS